MSLSATSHSIPDSLRQDILVAGRFHITTDEPVSAGGEDSAPSPHELLPAALASCVSTTIMMYARTKGWELGEVTVEVDYDHHANPRRCDIAITTERPLTPVQLTRLERVAATCPVRRAIESGIEFVEHIGPAGAGSRAA